MEVTNETVVEVFELIKDKEINLKELIHIGLDDSFRTDTERVDAYNRLIYMPLMDMEDIHRKITLEDYNKIITVAWYLIKLAAPSYRFYLGPKE